MNLNKGISTPIAILIIIACSAIVGVVVWQFSGPAEQPVPKQASDYTTQSACEEAGYYWYGAFCHEEASEKESQADSEFDAQVMIGLTSDTVSRVDPSTGEKNSQNLQTEHSAVFYSSDRTDYISGIDLSIAKLIEDGTIVKTGKTLPVLNIDILAVEDRDKVEGEVIRSFQNHSFEIGAENHLSIDRSVNSDKVIAAKITIDKVEDLKEEKTNYYLVVPAKKEGDNPVAITELAIPLYKYTWRHDAIYDAKINFIYEDRDIDSATGKGRVRSCEWENPQQCNSFAGGHGDCYQIDTKQGLEIVEYSEVGDLQDFVGEKVKWFGSRKDAQAVCSDDCPCDIVLSSIHAYPPEKLASKLYQLTLVENPQEYAEKKNVELVDNKAKVIIEKSELTEFSTECDINIDRESQSLVEAWVPIDNLVCLAAESKGVAYIRLPYPATTNN